MDKPQKKVIKPPVIRQTKSSIYRMARANPLLVEQNRIKIENEVFRLPQTVTASTFRRLTTDDFEWMKQKRSESLELVGKQSLDAQTLKNGNHQPKAKSDSLKGSTNVKLSSDKQKLIKAPLATKNNDINTNGNTNKPKFMKNLPRSQSMKTQRPLVKTEMVRTNSSNKPITKSAPPNRQVDKKLNNDKPVKNSLPSQDLKKEEDYNFKKPIAQPPKSKTKVRRSLSAEHIAKTARKSLGAKNEILNKSSSVKNLISESMSQDLHYSSFKQHRQSMISSTPMPRRQEITSAYNRLQQPLKDWLKRQGKSLNNYHHLKCFGLQELTEEEQTEDKENIEEQFVVSKSYEDLRIPQDTEALKLAVSENVVTGAIEDLQNLIEAGYPVEQCEQFLNYIREKHVKVEDQPHYWECRAAIEQRRGNIANAVECYKNSIVKGADVEQIDESLSQLLEKFNLLNIEPEKKAGKAKQKRNKKEAEVRNIFKSTIIQFAIKVRALNVKKEQYEASSAPITEDGEKKKFVATPVRRSTRKSCGKYQRTPGKTLCDSLNDLDNSIKESLEFKSNSYLK